MFKFLDPSGCTVYNGKPFEYTLPRREEKWSEWTFHPDPRPIDGHSCGPNRLHLMKRLSSIHALPGWWPWWAEGRVLVGSDHEKLACWGVRLRRIKPRTLARALRPPFNWGRGTVLDGLRLDGQDLNGADLSNTSLKGACITACSLKNANISNAFLTDASVRYCDLYSANIEGSTANHVDFHGSNMSSANLRHSRLLYANLSNVRLYRANVCGADLQHAIGLGMSVKDIVVWDDCTKWGICASP